MLLHDRQYRVGCRILMIAGITLTSCNGSTIDPDSSPPATGSATTALTLSPPAATIRLGENLTIHASLSGVTSPSVTFRSFNPVLDVVNTAPFSVTVRSVHPGDGVIQAYPAGDSSQLRPRAHITVTPPTFMLDSIFAQGTSAPVSGAVSGAVNFRFIVAGTPIADSMRVTARAGADTLRTWQCASPRAAGTERVSILCPIDTNSSDGAGRLLFPNGHHTLRARLIAPTGSAVLTVTHPFVVSNPGGTTVNRN